jgi:hypothetical protein
MEQKAINTVTLIDEIRFCDACNDIEDVLGQTFVNDLCSSLPGGESAMMNYDKQLVVDISAACSRLRERAGTDRPRDVGRVIEVLFFIRSLLGYDARVRLHSGQINGGSPELDYDNELVLDIAEALLGWQRRRIMNT